MNSIREVGSLIQRGEISPRSLVEDCLNRIQSQESSLHAWVFVDRKQALEDADRLAVEIAQNKYRGPLHGIPLGVKDIFDVANWPTAAGSPQWKNRVARRDAIVVQMLRDAGAIFLGKTVTTAYASFDPPPTTNPWDASRTPGGSSSGSAAAIAAGMCYGALASQTGGSITRPASFCGISSLKPTYNRVSLQGVLPLAPSLDHVGVMAGNVQDLAILFSAITNPMKPFSYEKASVEPSRIHLTQLLGFFQERAEPAMQAALAHALSCWQHDGATIERLEPPQAFRDVLKQHRLIMAVEAAEFHEARQKEFPEEYPSQITSLLQEGYQTRAIEYLRARHYQKSISTHMNELFSNRILVTPATLGTAPDAKTTGDPAFNSPWSMTGQPTVSFPIAWTDEGLPLCVQMIGSFGSEEHLFEIASWCEKTLGLKRNDKKA